MRLKSFARAIGGVALALSPACQGKGSSADHGVAVQAGKPTRTYEFRGLRLGDPLSKGQIQALHLDCDSLVCSINHDTIAGIEVFTTIGLVDGRVSGIVASFPSDNFDVMRTALISKWGTPDTNYATAVKNRLGAVFEKQVAQWRMIRGTLILSSIGDKVTEGDMAIVDEVLSKISMARDSARVAAAAKKTM